MKTQTSIKIVGLGVKFGGMCVCCNRETGNRDFEKADTLLVKQDDKFAVAHPICMNVRTKSKIGGGRKIA